MQLSYKEKDGMLIVYLSGELDHHSARDTREAIDDLVSVHRAKALRLDFLDVTFMDSSGVGLVLGRYKLMRERGGNAEIVSARGHIKRIFELSGVTQLINFR